MGQNSPQLSEEQKAHAVTGFSSLGSKHLLTGGDCSHGIRRRLLLGRENLDKPRQ